MIEFFLTFLIFTAVVVAMSVGVIHGRAPIAGSCGGLNNMGEAGACEICGGDTSKCESSNEKSTEKGRFYDAS
jgi:hypothetical protein